MNDIYDKAKETVSEQTAIDNTLRDIFIRHFNIDDESNKDNAGYLAWATFATEVGVKLANMIIAIKKPTSGRSFRAISDLVFELSSNEFWNRNSQVLMPLVMAIMSSHRDYVSLVAERTNLQEYASYDKLISGSATMPLEIFSVLAFLVGGAELMVSCSLPMKLELMPIIVG